MERTLKPEFEDELKSFLESINHKYDYDFRQYSSSSVKRTVIQAMNSMDCPTLLDLQKKVLADSLSFERLLQILTIPVSQMFRDPSYYLSLREKIVPILKTYPSIKVWVAGCSTGEEVYSLAILLREEELLEKTTLYATDINAISLVKAEKGVFSLEAIEMASQHYLDSGGKRSLSDYYKVIGKTANFHANLKKNITFSDHSLVTDAVFSEMHLISCRNVLIYFNRQLQDKVYSLFHASLCRKCFLGLGGKETMQFSLRAKDFVPFVKKERIYQKN